MELWRQQRSFISYTTPQPAVQHTYQNSGVYLAKLTTTNGSCSVSDSVYVYVFRKQTPVLSAPVNTFCSSDTLHAIISGMENNPYNLYNDEPDFDLSAANYGDGSPFAGSLSITDLLWQNPFHVDIRDVDVTQTELRIITTSRYFNCQDTTNYFGFQALGPVAAFSAAKGNLCYKTPLVLNDESKESHNSPIVKWEWNFGDSAFQVQSSGAAVNHQYAEPGSYLPVLTVTDANQCTSSTSASTGFIDIKGPKADFSVSENPVLPQTNVAFYNQTNTTNTVFADNTYTWNFGDGTILRKQPFSDSVIHSYQREGTDTVTLIASNAVEKCADTAYQVIIVKNPNLYFTYTTTYINPESGCPPVIASFINTSINTTSISWDFGDGSTADNLENASHIYEKPGVYKVTLYGYFLDGSIDSTSEFITIKGPYASLKTDTLFVCGSELITLTATASNTETFTWDFGDGTLANTTDTFLSHRYLTAGVYTPSLIVEDANNCRFPYFLSQPITIDTLHISINQDAEVACSASLLYFTPAIVSQAKDQLGLPLTYHWTYGTGAARDTANTESGQFQYNKPGSYAVTLTATSPFGCTAIARDTVVVQPSPIISIGGPANVCQDAPVTFTGSATRPTSWMWQFPNGDTSELQNPAVQTFSTPGQDSIIVIADENGCRDTAIHQLLVNKKPEINPLPSVARLCQGDSLQLEAHDGETYNWTPAQNIQFANTATPTVFPSRTSTYFVDVTNAAGCSSSDSVPVLVIPRFHVTTLTPVYVCPGGVAQLNAYGADNYFWLDVEVSNPGISNPTIASYATRAYTVVGKDDYGCFTDTAIAQVIIAPLPTVSAGEDIVTLAGTPVKVEAMGSSDIVKWEWTPAQYINCDTCPVITVTPRSDIEYIVKGTTDKGCFSADSLRVSILCKSSQIKFPSAFTPNDDGRNDRFGYLGNGVKEVKHFAVFDRLGTLLFEKRNMDTMSASSGWDGTFNGKKMPPATYVFIADLVCDTGEEYRYKGTVVLIR